MTPEQLDRIRGLERRERGLVASVGFYGAEEGRRLLAELQEEQQALAAELGSGWRWRAGKGLCYSAQWLDGASA